MNWISIKDKLPESGQEVLAYFYDTPYEIDQFCTLTYFRKGDALENEMPHTERVELARTKTDPAEELMTKLFACRVVEAPRSGFYIYDVGLDGMCAWRRHSDIVTHWAELVPPEVCGD